MQNNYKPQQWTINRLEFPISSSFASQLLLLLLIENAPAANEMKASVSTTYNATFSQYHISIAIYNSEYSSSRSQASVGSLRNATNEMLCRLRIYNVL